MRSRHRFIQKREMKQKQSVFCCRNCFETIFIRDFFQFMYDYRAKCGVCYVLLNYYGQTRYSPVSGLPYFKIFTSGMCVMIILFTVRFIRSYNTACALGIFIALFSVYIERIRLLSSRFMPYKQHSHTLTRRNTTFFYVPDTLSAPLIYGTTCYTPNIDMLSERVYLQLTLILPMMNYMLLVLV